MPSCSAIGCTNTSRYTDKDGRVTLHRFPVRDKRLAQIWAYNMNRDGFVPNENSRLCSRHFLPDSYEEDKYAKYGLSVPSKIRRLKKDAVPTENFPFGPRNRPVVTEEGTGSTYSLDSAYRSKDNSPYPVSLFQIIHPSQQSLQKSSLHEIQSDSLKTELENPGNHEIYKKEANNCSWQPRHTRTSQDVVYFPEPMVPEPESPQPLETSRTVPEACSQTDIIKETNLQDVPDISVQIKSETDCNEFPETTCTLQDVQTLCKQDKETQMDDLTPSTVTAVNDSETPNSASLQGNQSTKVDSLFSSPNTSFATTEDIYGIPEKIYVEKEAGEPPTEYVAAFVYLPDDMKSKKSKKILGVDKKGLIYLPRDTYDSIAESGPLDEDSGSEWEPTEEEKLQHGSYSSKHDHPYCSSGSVSRSVQTKEVPVAPMKKGRRKKKRGRKHKVKTTETEAQPENNDMPSAQNHKVNTTETGKGPENNDMPSAQKRKVKTTETGTEPENNDMPSAQKRKVKTTETGTGPEDNDMASQRNVKTTETGIGPGSDDISSQRSVKTTETGTGPANNDMASQRSVK